MGNRSTASDPEVAKSLVVLLLLAFVLCVAARPLLGHRVTDETGRSVNVPDHPQRVISLAPSITEIVFALGVGDRLVGDTEYCDYPPEAKRKPHVGAVLNPSLEQIVALKPDLVLGIAEANRRETAEQLERLRIPLYGLTAHTMDDMFRSIGDLGSLLGREAEARTLIAGLQGRTQAVAERVKDRPRPKVLFVVWYQPLVTTGPHTFISDVIQRAGGDSITDDLREEWPRLSLEEALHRDPDIILFPRSESFAPSLGEFRKLPGWRDFRAVKNNRLSFIPDTIVRPCPRLVDALEEVARVLHPEAAATGPATSAER
jgi:iron complex transport system substrate-binding protein